VKPSENSALETDLLVCASCANTTYAAEEIHAIPGLHGIIDSLRWAEYHIDKINLFKDENKLDIWWSKLLPDIRRFKEKLAEINKRLKKVQKKDNLIERVNLQINSRSLINVLFNSELMKQYNRHLHCKEFKQDSFSKSRTQPITNAYHTIKLAKLRSKIEEEELIPLSEQLQKANKLSEERLKKIQELTQEKLQFEKKLAALEIQENHALEEEKAIKDQEIQLLQQKVKTFSEEEQKLTSQLEEVKTEYENLSHQIEGSNYTLSHSEYGSIYSSIIGKSKNFTELSKIYIKLDNSKYQTLLKLLQFFKLPASTWVYLFNMYHYNSPSLINRFMKNALHDQIKQFNFNFGQCSGDSTKDYMETLKKVMPRIKGVIEIGNMKLTRRDFEDLIVAAKNCECIKFNWWSIETDGECTFQDRLDDASFTKIAFDYSGKEEFSNWKENGYQRFKNIVNGLAKVESVKEREIQVELTRCDLDKQLAEYVFNEAGMDKVTIEGL